MEKRVKSVGWALAHAVQLMVLLACVLLAQPAVAAVSQTAVSRIEAMPNMPSPYIMRDWKQVATNYDNYVFDFNKTGEHLPLIWWDTTHTNFPLDTFGLPSYVGHFNMSSGNNHEGINCMGAVLGASLIGIDKSDQNGQDFVLMMQNYYNVANGENLALNRSNADTGGSFWYEIFPTLLYCQLLALYPGTGDMEAHMYAMADKWYNASYVMGGRTDPWALPDFNHQAFDFDTMTPADDRHTEPEVAAAIAWLDYMAYVKWGQPQHLTAAQWGLEYLENQTVNPLYECLLPYGVITAARMNAELGEDYDLHQLLTWCFEPGPAAAPRTGWGVISDDPWGGIDCDGLVGSSTDTGGYAFAMNTYHWAAALAPVVRYDQRYARAIGKWMLNLANASRLFYANGHDAAHQTSKDWADAYDPDYCITYEGMRKFGRINERVAENPTISYGTLVTGTYEQTFYEDDDSQVFMEQTLFGGKDALEVIWRIPLAAGTDHQLRVDAQIQDAGDGDDGFTFSYATSIGGPYTEMFTVNTTEDKTLSWIYWYQLPDHLSGDIYVKAADTNRFGGNYLNDWLYVDDLHVWTDITTSPFATGDAISGFHNKGTKTDFALYGASHVGMLGAVVETTDQAGILQIDLLATDYYHDDAYPTYLYYNPHANGRSVSVDVGPDPVDLYDTVSQRILQTNVTGTVLVSIAPDSAIVLVLAPAHAAVTLDGAQKLMDGVIVDYRANSTYSNCGEVLASPHRFTADIVGNCRVDASDLLSVIQQWLEQQGIADINGDGRVDLDDFSEVSALWLQCNDPLGASPCTPNW